MTDTAKKHLPCPKCAGTGTLWEFSHVKAGECFSCFGTGIKHRVKRQKKQSHYWLVFSPEFDKLFDEPYLRRTTEADALELAKEMQPMHLLPLQLVEKTYTYYETKRVI